MNEYLERQRRSQKPVQPPPAAARETKADRLRRKREEAEARANAEAERHEAWLRTYERRQREHDNDPIIIGYRKHIASKLSHR